MSERNPSIVLFALLIVACNKSEPTSATVPGARAAVSSAPAASAPAAAASPDTVPTSAGDVRITPIQHATVLFEYAGKSIYADPAPGPSYDGRPKADLILVTDIHRDHLSPPTIAALKKPDTKIVAPPAASSELSQESPIILKNGETKEIAGVTVEAVPMYNLKRGPSAGQFYHDKGRGNGYVVTMGGKRFYLSGDTECIPEMKALKNIDVAFVCMNLPYTMPPAEAAECIKAFQPKILYPYHYRGSNLEELKTALAGEKGIELRVRNWYP